MLGFFWALWGGSISYVIYIYDYFFGFQTKYFESYLMDKVSNLIVSWQSFKYFDEMNYCSNEFPTFAVTSPMNGILERVGQKEGGSSMTVDQIISALNDLECISTTRDPEQFTFGKTCT
jgi:hypothetical protein